jgi:hypothetical protein
MIQLSANCKSRYLSFDIESSELKWPPEDSYLNGPKLTTQQSTGCLSQRTGGLTPTSVASAVLDSDPKKTRRFFIKPG